MILNEWGRFTGPSCADGFEFFQMKDIKNKKDLIKVCKEKDKDVYTEQIYNKDNKVTEIYRGNYSPDGLRYNGKGIEFDFIDYGNYIAVNREILKGRFENVHEFNGTYVDGKKTGTVTNFLVKNSTDRFVGNIENDLPTEGQLNDKNGTLKSIGTYDKNLNLIKGRKLDKGKTEEGTFKDNKLVEGKRVNDRGEKEEGIFEDNKLVEGKRYKLLDIIQEGKFVNDKLVSGKIYKDNNLKLKGTFDNNEQIIEGIEYYNKNNDSNYRKAQFDGNDEKNRFEGTFENGKPINGIMYYLEGYGKSSFKGTFGDGYKPIEGEGYYDGKIIFKGSTNGAGKEFYENGDIKFDGIFKDGKYSSGKLILILYDNENIKAEIEGEFKNGKIDIGTYKKISYGIIIVDGKINDGGRFEGKEYYSTGKLSFEGSETKYFENNNNKKIGKFFNEKGELEFDGEKQDRDKKKGKMYENGVLIFEGEFNNDFPFSGNVINFEFKHYIVDEDGYLRKTPEFTINKYYNFGKYHEDKIVEVNNVTIKNGTILGTKIIDGNVKIIDKNFLTFEGEYKDAEKIQGKEYDNLTKSPNNLVFDGSYKYGKRDKGYSIQTESITNFGKITEKIIIFEGTIENGKRVSGKEYDKKGNVIFEGTYDNNVRSSGKVYQYDNSNNRIKSNTLGKKTKSKRGKKQKNSKRVKKQKSSKLVKNQKSSKRGKQNHKKSKKNTKQ
jgi:hypothetical protein